MEVYTFICVTAEKRKWTFYCEDDRSDEIEKAAEEFLSIVVKKDKIRVYTIAEGITRAHFIEKYEPCVMTYVRSPRAAKAEIAKKFHTSKALYNTLVTALLKE